MNTQNQNQQNAPGFTEIGGSGDSKPFKPHASEDNGFTYMPGAPHNVLEGYYKGGREVTTQFGPGIVHDIHHYNARTGELGEVYGVFQDAFLKERFAKTPLGAFIRLEYKGKELKKAEKTKNPNQPWSKSNSYHSWFIGFGNGVAPYAETLKRYAGRPNQPASGAPPSPPWLLGQQQAQQAPPQQGQGHMAQPPQYAPPAAQQYPPQQQQGQQWAPPPQQAPQQGYNTASGTGATSPQAPPAWAPPPNFNTPPAQQAPPQPPQTWTPPPQQAPQAPPAQGWNPPPAGTPQPAQNQNWGTAPQAPQQPFVDPFSQDPPF